MINSVGLQGPGVERLAGRRAAGAAAHAAPASWPAIWGRTVDDYAAAAELLAAAPAGGRGRRGQPVVPEPRGPRRMFAHSPERDRGGRWRRPRRAGGRGGPSSARTPTDLVEIAAAAAERGRRGGHAGQHRARHGDRRRDAAGRCSVAGGGGLSGPAIHPVAVRAVLRRATPRFPTCRSSGVGGVAPRPRRGRAAAGRRVGRAGGHGDLRRSPGARPRCWPSSSDGAGRHGRRRGVGRAGRSRPRDRSDRMTDARDRLALRARRRRPGRGAAAGPAAAARGSAWPRSASSCSRAPGPRPSARCATSASRCSST